MQRAGVVALKEGEPVIARTVARFRKARDFPVRELNAIEGFVRWCFASSEEHIASGIERLRRVMVRAQG